MPSLIDWIFGGNQICRCYFPTEEGERAKRKEAVEVEVPKKLLKSCQPFGQIDWINMKITRILSVGSMKINLKTNSREYSK